MIDINSALLGLGPRMLSSSSSLWCGGDASLALLIKIRLSKNRQVHQLYLYSLLLGFAWCLECVGVDIFDRSSDMASLSKEKWLCED